MNLLEISNHCGNSFLKDSQGKIDGKSTQISPESNGMAISHIQWDRLSESEGRKRHGLKAFPYNRLEQWIRNTFREGFHPDFVPALLRNIKGLVAWVYGGENEPYWQQSDNENSKRVL